MKQPSYVGVGLYSYPEAARIIGVKLPKLRRWVGKDQGTSRSAQSRHKPVIDRYFEDGQRVLTFLELVELLCVKLFRAEGVSMHLIRRAAEEATHRFNTAYPFAVKRFDTDGNRIFTTLREASNGEGVMEELGKAKLVFDTVVRPFFRKLDYHNNAEALRYWPLDHDGRVVLDPQRAFGKPIDAETGVPTGALYDAVMAGGGQGPEAVAEWFKVPLAAVKAAVEYETTLLAA
jgi:uncharacterized protein (DUF433 family)